MKWTLCLLVVMATLTLASSSVQGKWGPWWQATWCSVTCGNGTITFERTCDGNDCIGEDNENRPCSYAPCNDECWNGPGESGPCKNLGECEDQDLETEGTFTCTCKTGYTGDTCQKADCALIPDNVGCSDGRQCIWYGDVCDGENDCGDGSDEDGCGGPVNCTDTTHFQCTYETYPKCWKNEAKCDQMKNCDDFSDEDPCEPLECEANEFLCKDKDEGIQACMSNAWKCDGLFDCKDNSDETNCIAECPSDYTKIENYCVIKGASGRNFWDAKKDCETKGATLWPSSSISADDQRLLIPEENMNTVNAWTEVGADYDSGCQVWSFKGQREKKRRCGQESTYFCFIHLIQK